MEKKSSKLKYLYIFMILLVVLLVVGAILAKPMLETYIKDLAESSLTESHGAEVNIASVELEVFDQKVIINGLEMTHPYKPKNNIVHVPKTWMQFKLDKYFSDDIVYLDKAELLNVKVDTKKASGKAGWIDREKYPKSETSTLDIKKVDLKALKVDFKQNFAKELKETEVYQNYKQKTEKYESLIEGKYKTEYKEIESRLKDLKGLKLDSAGIKKGLAALKGIDRKYDSLKNIGRELKSLKSEISNFNSAINKGQEQILSRFLDQHGLGNIGDMLQSNIESMLLPKPKKKKQVETKKKEVEPVKPVAAKKAIKKTSRDDVLFYVNEVLIKGDGQKFSGEVRQFTNKPGEAPNLWEGVVKLAGEVLPGTDTDINASGKNGKWDIGAKLNDLSLQEFDLLEEIDIDKGFLDFEMAGSLKQAASLKGIVNLNLEELSSTIFKKYGKWGKLIQDALVSNAFKLSFKGFSSDYVNSDIQWDLKWLSSIPDLLHPLKNEAKSELNALAKVEVSKLKQKLVEVDEVQKLKTQMDDLKRKFRTDTTKKLLKGLFDKL